jgi:hypothetical protein
VDGVEILSNISLLSTIIQFQILILLNSIELQLNFCQSEVG